MKKTEVYNSDYTELNHAYILIYESYQKLVKCKDADKVFCGLLIQPWTELSLK